MPRPPPPYAALIATGHPTLLAERDDVVDALDRVEGAGHARDPAAVRGPPGRDLVAHDVDGFGRRADPGDPAVADHAGELGVLGVEPVAGVHAVDAGALDHAEDRVGVQVALGRGLAAERVRLVRVAHVQRITVELGVDRDGGDSQLAAGPHHADGDLAAVGDQDLLEHEHLCQGDGVAVSYGPCPIPRPVRRASASVRWLVETDSTNRYLLDAARSGAPDGLVVVADHQRAGPGPTRPHLERTARRVAARLGAAASRSRRRTSVTWSWSRPRSRWPRPSR